MEKTNEDIMILWNKYIKNKDESDRDELILYYSPMVKSIVYRMIPSYSKYVDVDDLMGYGILGLIDAIDRYEANRGVPFENYAYMRVKGEVIDYLRRQDFISTSLRQKIKLVENAMQELELKYGRSATEEELSNYLNIDLKTLHKILEDAYNYNVVYFEDILETCLSIPSKNNSELPENAYDKKELKGVLKNCIDDLGNQEKLMISLYYYEELNIKEIAQVLNVSESRVSQIHSKALFKLRSKLSW